MKRPLPDSDGVKVGFGVFVVLPALVAGGVFLAAVAFAFLRNP